MLITLSVIFQSAPVFLPFVGLIISPFSTLPIMLATYFRLSLGVLTYISAAFLLMFVSIQESVIFLFTTGIFGIAIGAFLFRKSIIISIIISGIVLTFGMMTLTFAMGIAAFGDFTYKFSILSISIIFGAFSIIYASF